MCLWSNRHRRATRPQSPLRLWLMHILVTGLCNNEDFKGRAARQTPTAAVHDDDDDELPRLSLIATSP